MHLSIDGFLSEPELVDVRQTLSRVLFAPGVETAGWAVASVKHNQQAIAGREIEDLVHQLTLKLLANEVFQLAARPKRIVKAMFSRYRAADRYGWHADNALMEGERTDLSFTLFLSPPQTYEGGELTIESAGGTDAVRLPAGSVFLYPSTTLHQVTEVTSGERLALIGWVRSYVRDTAKRELLFDLDTARRTLFDRDGKSAEFDLLSKSSANLLRMWCDD